MKIIERLKDSYKNKKYYISVYDDGIYIINYKNVKYINDKKLEILFDNFSLIINGSDLKIIRKDKFDLELSGSFASMEINSGLYNN